MSELTKIIMISGRENRYIAIPCEVYTNWGGRANIVHHLENYKGEIQQLKDQLKSASEVIEFYGDPCSYNMESSFIQDDDELISYINESQWEVGNITKYPMQDYVGGKRARQWLKDNEIK